MAKTTPRIKTGIFKKLNELGMPWKNIRFHIEDDEYRLLGSGSFAEVYEMEEVNDPQKKYAVKIIGFNEQRRIHRNDVGAMKKEALYQYTLSEESSSVVRVYAVDYISIRLDNNNGKVLDVKNDDSGADKEGWLALLMIRMELLRPILDQSLTGDLSLTVPGLEAIDESEIIRLALNIAGALDVSHKHNVTHRDVKLENIFYDSESRSYKLGDFGIARITNQGSASTKGAGTHGYQAPEVSDLLVIDADDGKDAAFGHYDSFRADIYSFGVSIYLLLNDLKFPGSGTYFVNRRVQYNPNAKMPLPAHGSDELKKYICSLIRFRPEDRPKSINEVIKAIKDIAGIPADRSETEAYDAENSGSVEDYNEAVGTDEDYNDNDVPDGEYDEADESGEDYDEVAGSDEDYEETDGSDEDYEETDESDEEYEETDGADEDYEETDGSDEDDEEYDNEEEQVSDESKPENRNTGPSGNEAVSQDNEGSVKIISPIRGFVKAVSVKTGDKVKKGQVILKIKNATTGPRGEYDIVATADGTVASVNAKTFSPVYVDDVLVTIEPFNNKTILSSGMGKTTERSRIRRITSGNRIRHGGYLGILLLMVGILYFGLLTRETLILTSKMSVTVSLIVFSVISLAAMLNLHLQGKRISYFWYLVMFCAAVIIMITGGFSWLYLTIALSLFFGGGTGSFTVIISGWIFTILRNTAVYEKLGAILTEKYAWIFMILAITGYFLTKYLDNERRRVKGSGTDSSDNDELINTDQILLCEIQLFISALIMITGIVIWILDRFTPVEVSSMLISLHFFFTGLIEGAIWLTLLLRYDLNTDNIRK